MRRFIRNLFVSLALVLLIVSVSSAEITRTVVPLEREGIKLHLECMSSGDGEPLLLVHSVTYSSHVFDVDYKDYSLAKFFVNNGFSVWLLDIACYGRSQAVEDGFTPDADYAAEDILAAVKVILERSGRKSIDVLGCSWGTLAAGRFAADNPELVHRLVLYAPLVAGLGEADVEEPFRHNTWENAVGDFQMNPDGSINYDIVEPEVVSTFTSNCWRYDGDSSPNGGRRDLFVASSDRLIPTERIEVPVLIIVGSKDPNVSPELCREAFATLENKASRLDIIDGAAHAMMIEKPYYRIFRQKILAFLRAN